MIKSLKKHEAIITFLLFMGINILSILRMEDSIGLYLDAVNPDYLATQILNNSNFSSTVTLPFVGIPLLGQIYHGTVTMFGSLLSMLITGTTSVLQHRITNSVYAALATTVLYKILKSMNVSYLLSLATCILLCLSPNLIATFFTQYYIELPGVLFLLLQIYYLLKWRKNGKSNHLLLTGIFGGLAIYDYFNFVFFVPSVLLLTIIDSLNKKEKRLIESFFVLITGYAIGVTPYVAGLIELLLCSLKSMSDNIKIAITLGISLLIIAVLFYIYKLQNNTCIKNKVISIILLATGAALVLVLIVFVISEYQNYFLGLHIEGESGDLFTRIKLVWTYLCQVLCHSSIEYLIIGKYTSVLMWTIPTCTVVISFITLYFHNDKENEKINYLSMIYFITVIYLICCIAMVTRMQGQHFICILFLMYIALGLAVSLLSDYMSNNDFKINSGKTIKIIYLVICIILMFNQTSIVFKVKNVNGLDNSYNKYYSNAIQRLSEHAIERKNNGEKQYYVFPEWGMICGFDYLTGNSIHFSGFIDNSALKWLNEENGYVIIVCYWDEEKTETYKSQLLEVFSEEKLYSNKISGNYGSILELIIE